MPLEDSVQAQTLVNPSEGRPRPSLRFPVRSDSGQNSIGQTVRLCSKHNTAHYLTQEHKLQWIAEKLNQILVQRRSESLNRRPFLLVLAPSSPCLNNADFDQPK